MRVQGKDGYYEIENGNITYYGTEPKRVRGFELVSNAPEDTKLPTRKTKGSAGYDAYLPCDLVLEAGEISKPIYLGVKAYMGEGECLHIFVRSSVGLVRHVGLPTGVSVVDRDYYNCEDNEGNIGIVLYNFGKERQEFKKGERIVQMKFSNFLTTDDDNVTEERKGGIGSTNGIFKKG